MLGRWPSPNPLLATGAAPPVILDVLYLWGVGYGYTSGVNECVVGAYGRERGRRRIRAPAHSGAGAGVIAGVGRVDLQSALQHHLYPFAHSVERGGGAVIGHGLIVELPRRQAH